MLGYFLLIAGQFYIIKSFERYFLNICTTEAEDSLKPCWNNEYFSGLDAIALYSFLVKRKPNVLIEVGSGNSTKFARQAITDHGLSTRIISIDPEPREEIDSISDTIIHKPLQDADLTVFEQLKEGDILFYDGSHCCFMNSDVAVFFLEVLPKVPPGVIVHIHDIHLPNDYPPKRAMHHESEQYLVAMMLLAEGVKYNVVMPNKFVTEDSELSGILDGLWNSSDRNIPCEGFSFWLEKTR